MDSCVATYARTYVFVLWFGCVLRELLIVSPLTFQKNEQRPYAHGVNLPKQRTNQILICKYTYVRTYASARTDVRMSTYVRIHTCVRTYVRTYAYVLPDACVYVRTFADVTNTRAFTYVHRCTYVTWSFWLRSVHECVHTCECVRICIRACAVHILKISPAALVDIEG